MRGMAGVLGEPICPSATSGGDAVKRDGELYLKYSRLLPVPNDHLARGQAKLPQPAKPLPELARNGAAIMLETLIPVPCGLRVVRPEHLDIGDQQAAALDGRNDLREGRNVVGVRGEMLAHPVR